MKFQVSSLDALFEKAMQFYAGAIIREDFMMQRTRQIMAERKETKAVIITGGFHTEGFKEKITASGNSYIGITPAIGETTKDDQKNYLNALLGQSVSATRNAQRVTQNEAVARSTLSVERNDIAPISGSDFLFPQQVEPKTWRRELAVRFARIRDIVRQTVASFHNRVAENNAEFNTGFQNLIASTVNAPVPRLQPALASGRSEVRQGKQIFSLTQAELQGVKGIKVYAYLRSLGIEDSALQNSILTVQSRFSDQIYKITIGNKNEAMPYLAVDSLLEVVRVRDVSDVVFIEGHSILPSSSEAALRSEVRQSQDEDEAAGFPKIVEMPRNESAIGNFWIKIAHGLFGSLSLASIFLSFYPSVHPWYLVLSVFFLGPLFTLLCIDYSNWRANRVSEPRSSQLVKQVKTGNLLRLPKTKSGHPEMAIAGGRAVRSEARNPAIFTGDYSVKLDEKKRISIPAAFRKMAGTELIVVPEKSAKELRVYPLKTWQELAAAKRPQDPEAARKYDDQSHRGVFLAGLDSQGRLSLGEQIRRGVLNGSVKNFVIAGAGDSFLVTESRSELRAEIAELAEKTFSLYRANQTGYVIFKDGRIFRSPGVENSMVFLIKPSTGEIQEKTIAEVLGAAAERGYNANAIRVVNARDIREEGIIAKHYPRHSEVALRGENALEDDEWAALTKTLTSLKAQGVAAAEPDLVVSAHNMLAMTGMTSRELMTEWKKANSNADPRMRQVKIFAEGKKARAFRMAPIMIPDTARSGAAAGQTRMVLNGFYPAVVQGFETATRPTVAILFKKDPANASAWSLARMKKDFAGNTNAAQAAQDEPDSLRARAFRHDPALGIVDPNVRFDEEV
ncbi:MAG: hypothetical protein PHV97_07965, partial [Candidatus Omnitrophica bacterium]|nr:hypothetical protein [Candidatus Omnitrophota bacterium]